jgi:hypothetical protein
MFHARNIAETPIQAGNRTEDRAEDIRMAVIELIVRMASKLVSPAPIDHSMLVISHLFTHTCKRDLCGKWL